ncbi:MAG: hypothetical protein ACR2JU_08390 [Nocardioidaceae bacterium]
MYDLVSLLRRVDVLAHWVVITLRMSAGKQTDQRGPPLILPSEASMDLRRVKPLHEAGATLKVIAAEVGCDPRTVKKYLNGPGRPSAAPPRVIDHLAPVVDAWLAADVRLRATVIHSRLVVEHGFGGSYQRVKMYVALARPRVCAELGLVESGGSLHRRFETTPGVHAQVDWGTELRALARALGVRYVYSFHDGRVDPCPGRRFRPVADPTSTYTRGAIPVSLCHAHVHSQALPGDRDEEPLSLVRRVGTPTHHRHIGAMITTPRCPANRVELRSLYRGGRTSICTGALTRTPRVSPSDGRSKTMPTR